MAVDAAAAGMFVGGLTRAIDGIGPVDEDVLFMGALGGWLLGAPIIHAANGNGRAAAHSLGLRVLLPAGLLLVGKDPSGFGALSGLLLGVVAAPILDWFVLSRVDSSPLSVGFAGSF